MMADDTDKLTELFPKSGHTTPPATAPAAVGEALVANMLIDIAALKREVEWLRGVVTAQMEVNRMLTARLDKQDEAWAGQQQVNAGAKGMLDSHQDALAAAAETFTDIDERLHALDGKRLTDSDMPSATPKVLQ